MNVDILMATYNGEKYIAEQINSILKQSHTDWRLFIRDDCSTDGTLQIISEYAKKYPEKIFVQVNEKNIGSALTFFELIKHSTAEFIMTADQDDVWKSDKVEKTLAEMQRHDNSKPLLVHTDLTVTDENLNILHNSMIKAQHINTNGISLNKIVVQNCVTGCTMCFNRALANKLKYTDTIPVHDWWIACTCAVFGSIIYLPESTILYRQHKKNSCGAKDMKDPKYIAERIKNKAHSSRMLNLSYIMADELCCKYGNFLNEFDRKMLSDYADTANKSKFKKLNTIIKYNMWKSGIIRKIGQIWLL
jgi:glycosyltransferase involved in cell wall biosynthesis